MLVNYMPWKIKGQSLGRYKPTRKTPSLSTVHEAKSPKQLWNIVRKHLKNIPTVAKYKRKGRFLVLSN
jgi:hypothetical protein